MGGQVALEEGGKEEIGQGNNLTRDASAESLLSELFSCGVILLVTA